MKKSELIKQLKQIEGDPEVVVVNPENGDAHNINEIEDALIEGDKNDFYTFSKTDRVGEDRKGLSDCIILWI